MILVRRVFRRVLFTRSVAMEGCRLNYWGAPGYMEKVEAGTKVMNPNVFGTDTVLKDARVRVSSNPMPAQ